MVSGWSTHQPQPVIHPAIKTLADQSAGVFFITTGQRDHESRIATDKKPSDRSNGLRLRLGLVLLGFCREARRTTRAAYATRAARSLMPQQGKISILGPRHDGTYVVEFKTAEGKKLAIKVPRTATAELHAPTPDEGVMISLQKPEIRNVLKIGWTVVRGILELAIMVYVLGAMLDPGDTVIVAVLGIIYATIRSAALFQYFTITHMAWASDVQSLERRRLEDPNVDTEIAKTDASGSRILLNCYIAGAFVALQYIVCLVHIFSKV
jgi:hypothetical protein